MTPPLQPDEDYKEIAEIIYGVDEAKKLIKAKAHLPQVEAVFKVMEAREQAARIETAEKFRKLTEDVEPIYYASLSDWQFGYDGAMEKVEELANQLTPSNS